MYFFIDPANLTAQLAGDAYGPSDTDLTSIYRTTSRFDLTTEAKAFACRSGMMLVQQSTDDNSLVNLVIRPNNNLEVPLDVEYYIYRGVRKDSLISENGGCTIQIYNAATSNDLISRMRQDSLIEDFSCSQIGYDNLLLDTDLIDDFFSGKNLQVSPVYVEEGEWIGTFTTSHKIGFEIVLKSDFNSFDLGFLRAAYNQINVTALNGFEQRLKREDILKFIDPAAFFGMHHSQNMDYYLEGVPNNTRTTSRNALDADTFIYTKLLENFHTRNNVYVDIRSEKGYSYNFYQNYKVNATDLQNIQIRTQGGNTPLNAQECLTNEWPILILTATHTSGDENSLKLQLRIDDNLKPILYTKTNLNKDVRNAANTSSTNISSKYIKTIQLIDNGNDEDDLDNTAWTNVFRILFPNTQYGAGGNSNRNYISNYVRLHYYRTKHNANNANASVLENIHYYDSAFCSIDIPEFSLSDNLDVGSIESTNPIYVREPLHHDTDHPNYDANYNLEGTGNFELNMINGAYWGDGRVLKYARIEYENTAKVSGKEYLNTYDHQLSSFEQNYSYRLVRERLKFLCREYDIAGNTNDTKIPSINFFRSNDLADSGKNHKENCMFLGLTIDEMISLKADTQLSNDHQRFIHLQSLPGNPQQDGNDNRYFAYTVRLQGFDTNQDADIVTPQHNGINIIVYSRDNQFFSSYAFSEDEDITTLQDGTALPNRIEFRIYHDGIVKITDNIDLSLALTYNQNRIYYAYYDDEDDATQIQGLAEDDINAQNGLELVMANRMKRLTYQASNPRIISFPANQFPNVNTLTFIDDYEDYGIANVDAGNTYSNDNGDILVQSSIYRNDTGFRKYENQKRKCYLVRFLNNRNPDQGTPITLLEFTNANPNINLQYHQTLRLYPSIEVAAAFIGALIRFNNDLESTGFAYKDASCYPSAEHVNGEAADTRYHNTTQLNVDFINALRHFGFSLFRIGNSNHTISNNIYNHSDFDSDNNELRRNIFRRDGATSTLHQSHLHSTGVILNDGNKFL